MGDSWQVCIDIFTLLEDKNSPEGFENVSALSLSTLPTAIAMYRGYFFPFTKENNPLSTVGRAGKTTKMLASAVEGYSDTWSWIAEEMVMRTWGKWS